MPVFFETYRNLQTVFWRDFEWTTKAFEFKNRVLFLTGEFRNPQLYGMKQAEHKRARKNAAIQENHDIFGTPDPI